MLEKINRKNININRDYAIIILVGFVVSFCLFIVFAYSTPTPTYSKQEIIKYSSILIASWNANQTKLNKDILSDIKATGSKIVNGTISSGTTIITTRIDFLFHLSDKTVVYISPADVISLRPSDTSSNSNGIDLSRPLKYSVIVDGVTYTISVDDYRYSLTKLRNHDFVSVIWINDYYWWG